MLPEAAKVMGSSRVSETSVILTGHLSGEINCNTVNQGDFEQRGDFGSLFFSQ